MFTLGMMDLPEKAKIEDLYWEISRDVVESFKGQAYGAPALRGNSYSLVAGFAVKLAERLGRRRASDGAVTLNVPVNERTTLDDTRANAVALFNISIDPTVDHRTQALSNCSRRVCECARDRVLLQELRDDAAWTYVNEVVSGHPGSITTIHGGHAAQAFKRLFARIAKIGQESLR